MAASSIPKGGMQMIRKHAGTFVVAAVVAAVMASIPALGLSPSAPGTAIPIAKSAYRDGPFTIPNSNSLGQVAHLPVGKGKWVFWAKLNARNAGSAGGPIECKLVAGGDFDQSRAGFEANATGAHEDTVALNVVHVFSSPGVAKLKCSDFDTADVEGTFAKITGIKAGSLSNTQVSG